jgi:hypothetical protein
MSFYYALLTSTVVLWLVYRYVTYRRNANTAIPQPDGKKNVSEQEDPLKAYQDIEPLHDFDWESTPPMKLRPFKPKYHLTMGKEPSISMGVFITDRFDSYHSSRNGVPL